MNIAELALAILVPCITVGVLKVFRGREITIWEAAGSFGISLVLLLALQFVGRQIQTRDTEYWGSMVTHATYTEAWNERVPCRHTKYCTRMVRNGKTSRVERYPCGHLHLYDVDEHPPRWEMTDSLGQGFPISPAKFEELAARWRSREFRDMHRSYHTRDGDAYVSTWDGADATLEPVVTPHSYENRVQASTSIFNYPEVSTYDIEAYGLYLYPEVSTYCPSVIGNAPGLQSGNRYLDVWNARLGSKKQIRMWVLVYTDKPRQAGILQEALWKGGNKNEVVTCIGISKNAVSWCHVFTWSPRQDLKSEIMTQISGIRAADMEIISRIVVDCSTRLFQRRQFEGFKYIGVEPPRWWIWLTIPVLVLANVLYSWWTVTNDIRPRVCLR